MTVIRSIGRLACVRRCLLWAYCKYLFSYFYYHAACDNDKTRKEAVSPRWRRNRHATTPMTSNFKLGRSFSCSSSTVWTFICACGCANGAMHRAMDGSYFIWMINYNQNNKLVFEYDLPGKFTHREVHLLCSLTYVLFIWSWYAGSIGLSRGSMLK